MSDVFNILHITDLHYTNRTSRNREQSVIIKALLEDIEHITIIGLKPDVIVFNGDLANDADEDSIYWDAFEKFIEPLLQKTRLTGERLIIAPGNHDVQRSAVKRHAPLHREFYKEYGLREIDRFYSTDQSGELQSEKLKAFNDACELAGAPLLCPSKNYTVVDLANLGILFCIANTAYTSAGGLPDVEKDDYGKLLFSDYQCSDMTDSVSAINRPVKFFVGHHPFAWFKEDCARAFERFVAENFVGHFAGHIHQTDPQSIVSMAGECTRLQTGALHQGIDKWNGYTVVRVSPVSRQIEVLPRRYAADQKKFVSAIEMGDEGKFYPNPAARAFWRARPAINRKQLSEWVAEKLLPHFTARHADTLVGKSLDDVFHEHPMRSKLPDYEESGSLSDEVEIDFRIMCDSSENHVVVGDTNFGKSTLIKRVGLELIKQSTCPERLTIPAFFDFGDIELRGEGVIKAIRAATPGLSESYNLRQLLDEGVVTVIVDDVDPTDAKRFEAFVEFTCAYPRCRYILTSKPAEGLDIGIAADLTSCVSFKEVRLLPLKTKGIRAFTENYYDEPPEDCARIVTKIISTLKQAALPPTAFAVSVLLEVFEGLKGDVLINEVTLIERFIEYLLAKEKTSEATRAAFNFTDNTRCLAFLAVKMARENRYEMSYDEVLEAISEFIDEIGYPHVPKEIFERLIVQKVLRRTEIGNYRFYLRAFLEYFIAKGMGQDTEFFDWIMDPSRYLSFVHEIEFFCGLNPDRSDVLDTIASRHADVMNDFRNGLEIDFSEFEKVQLPSDKEGSLAELGAQLSQPKLTQEERDDRIDMELALSDNQNAYRPLSDSAVSQQYLSLTLYSSALRNLEHLRKEEKERHMKTLIQNWAEHLWISFSLIPSIVKHRGLRVNGVEYSIYGHQSMTDEKLTRMLMLYMPTGIGAMMRSYLGSEKMVKQVAFDLHGSDPAIIKLIRSFLLSDLDVGDWTSVMAGMQSVLHGKTYLSLVLMWKLNSILKMRDPTKENSERVVDLIARLYADQISKTPDEYNLNYSRKLGELRRLLQMRQMKERSERPSLITVSDEPGRGADSSS